MTTTMNYSNDKASGSHTGQILHPPQKRLLTWMVLPVHISLIKTSQADCPKGCEKAGIQMSGRGALDRTAEEQDADGTKISMSLVRT